MMLYVKEIINHQIKESTPSLKVAKSLGWTITIPEENTERSYDGSLWEKGYAPATPEPTYAEKRAAEYPAITEQLDMLYWDKINGTNIWQDAITTIKNKYPKP